MNTYVYANIYQSYVSKPTNRYHSPSKIGPGYWLGYITLDFIRNRFVKLWGMQRQRELQNEILANSWTGALSNFTLVPLWL